jgi:hypothetical protein
MKVREVVVRDFTKILVFVLSILGLIAYDATAFDNKRKQILAAAVATVPHAVPDRAPIPSQRDIDLAMKMFSIRTHKHVVGPTYNKNLSDRGITKGTIDSPTRIVEIGPSAFSSWGMLGSTLAHEIEVHANQSFAKILALDAAAANQPGTQAAEVEAYRYELKCKDRFGLTNTEVWLIEDTLKYYYGSTH